MSAFWPYIILAACVMVFSGVMILSLKRQGSYAAKGDKGSASRFTVSRRLKSLRIIMAFFGSLILTIGFAGAYFEVKRVGDNRYSELEALAQSVASGFDYNLIAPLTYTLSDTANAAYCHISDHLQIMASHNEHIQIFTMSMRDSVILFGPCSQNASFPWQVMPGDVYLSPPDGLASLFKSGRNLLVDPYEDEYGYYISAFAPVFYPLTSMPATVIGVVMEAKPFHSERALASVRPLVATLVLLLILFGGAIYLTQRSVLEFQRYRWWQSPEALFTFLIGLAIGGLVIWFSFTYETRYRQAIFSQSSGYYAARINDYFRLFDSVLHRSFWQRHSPNSIDEALFNRRIIPITNYSFVDASGLAVKADSDDPNGKWEMLHYFDQSIESGVTMDGLEGLLSNSADQIEMAKRNGLRGIVFLDDDWPEKDQAMVFLPIFSDGGESEMLFFVLINTKALLNAAVSSYGEPGFFNIKWYEYLKGGSRNEIGQSEVALSYDAFSIDMDSQHPAFIFGRVFVLSIQPGPTFMATHPQRALFYIIPIVLLFLFLTTFIVGVLTTERYRLERLVEQRTSELEASESRFSLLFNSALEGIALHSVVRDESGKIIDYVIEDVNPAYCRLLGMTVEEANGKRASVVYSNGNRAPYLDVYSKVVESGEPARFNDLYKPLKRHFDVSVTLVSPNQFATVFSDVTEIEEAAEALRNSEENYRFLVENQNDLIIKVDIQGRYLYASPSFCRFFGKEESEILGKVFIPQIDESDIVNSFKVLKDLASPPYRVSFEQKVKSAQGWRWLAWNNSGILENDEVVSFFGVGRDITKRKRSELALEDNQRKLQEQNDEYLSLNEEYMALNEELHSTNNELLSAIEKAQESERLKTAFLQNMSHEIRTPLNAVIGFSEMMSLSGFSDDEKQEFAEIVVNNSRQLLSLVDDIMTISTIETQQNRLSESLVQVPALLTELHAVFVNNVKKGVNLQILTPADGQNDFSIIADEMKLRQILNNLIGNAIKFTQDGSISFGYELVKDSVIRFFVKDTGIGILPEVQEKIFERFRQAGENIQKRYGGTGLGLAISKGQVELMGGRIWVESEVGKGSVFYFEIPLNQPQA